MAVSVDVFGKSLVASGLITADEVKSLWAALPADIRPKTGDAFAQLLVERGKLTAFQSKEILEGRGTRLVMGDYVILQEIGAGGMGQVYKARHSRMERVVALKVMSAAAMKDEAAVKRFQREVRAAARLEHSNIVTAYDSGEAGSVKYLVMQFVDGGDLSSLVKKEGPLSIERAVGYVVQAAQGLAFAHGEGVIHRDIKPANLLLDKKGVVKILDMGLARIESGDDGLTATEQVMGTVDYMSPEQAAQTKGVDGRADIYSLGCTLWFLLTAKKAYEADTMIARLMAHRDGPLPSLVQARDDAPWPLEQALHKMIAKRPQDRYQSMDEVVAALAPFGPSGAAVGMGSSIGMGGGPQDAELASFLKTVGPGTKPQVKPSPSATNVGTDVTAQFVSPDVSTDPKSEILPAPRSVVKPQTKGASVKGKKPPVALVAGGIGGLALLMALGVWLIVRDKDGNEVARVEMPAGGSVTVVEGTPIKAPGANPGGTVTTRPTPDFFSAIGNASAAPPPGDYALTLENADTGLGLDFSKPFTLEAYITPRGENNLVQAAITCPSILNLHGGKEWTFHLISAARVGSGVAPVVGKRTHVAGVYTPQSLQIFVDGVLKRTTTLGVSEPPAQAPLHLGYQFTDRIDEIRVSKSARYTQNFIPAARHEPDADTLLLYHCDEGFGNFLKDASGNRRDALIRGARWTKADGSPIPPPTVTPTPSFVSTILSPGEQNLPAGKWGLKFEPGQYIETVPAPFRDTRLVTTEIWLTDESTGGHINFVDGPNGTLVLDHGNFFMYTAHAGNPPGIPAVKQQRIHLAAVNDGKGRKVFLNGKLAAQSDDPGIVYPDRGGKQFPILIGDKVRFCGVIDAVRISSTPRYTQDFTPPESFTPDKDTFALYRFDEGTGDVLEDSSGNNYHGKIVGATWVRGGATPAPPPAFPFATTIQARWPLSPSKPADIVWLQGLQATLTLRTGPATDLVLKPTDAPPTGAATIVGAAFDRDSGAAVTDDVLKRLATLVDLESLSLMLGETAPATKQGLPQLATLVHLRHLGLGRIGPPATDPAFLGALTGLESLALQYATFTGWEPVVARLPLLRELKIHGVDDAQLEQLGPAPRLTTLTLSGYTPGRAQRDAAAKRLAALAPWCRITLHDDKVDKNRVVIEPTAPPPPSVAAPGDTWTIMSTEARDRLAQLARKSSNSFISHDGLTLGGHSLTTDRDVVLATRDRVGDPWPTPVNLGPVVNIAGGLNGGEDTHPTISQDRTTLVFFSKRPPKEGLFSTVRGDAAQPFAAPVRLGDAINFPRDGRSWYPGLSADGRWLTFGRMDNARNTSGYVAQRAGAGAEFAAAQPLGPAIDALGDLRSSSITNDGLTLVVVAAQTGVPKEPKTLWTATRRSTEAPFENPVQLGPQFAGENLIATLSGDGRTLWAVRDDEVLQAVRSTPTAAIPSGNSPVARSADVVYLDDLTEKSYFGLKALAKPDRNPNDVAESSRVFPGAPLVHALHVHPEDPKFDKQKYAAALPSHKNTSRLVYDLDGKYALFQSGFRSRTGSSNLHAEVWGDGKRLWESGAPLPQHPADVTAEVDVRGVRELTLFTRCEEGKTHVLLTEPRLTPAASAAPSEPRTSVSGTTAAPQPAIFPFDAAAARKHQEAWAAYLGVPVEFTNSVGMKFRLIPPGEFQMGLGPEVTDEEVRRLTGMTNDRDLEKFNSCRAAHHVRITRPFYMEVEEVTTGRYQAVVGELRPNMTDGADKPLEHYVAWPDAIAFCNKLSEREGKRPAYRIEGAQVTPIDDADGYRLPIEAQWEYACRAGTNTLWYFGNEGSPDGKTFKTQCVAPNPFGLTGLYGGAYEWCWDATHNNFDPYPAAPPAGRVDPREDVGTMRIKRGGSGNDGGGASRISINSFARNKGSAAPYGPDTSPYSGFGRVVLPIATSASQPAAPKGDEAGGLTQIELLTSPDYEWTEPENLGPTVNGPDGQSLSSLTGDELLVYYYRKGGDDGQQDELWEATRTSREVPFDNPRLVMLGSGVYLSGDGLTRVKGVRTLSVWQRSSLDREFGPQTPLNFELGSYARFPTLSPDGLALVFSLKADQEERFELWMSRRASRDVDFGPPTKFGPVVNDGGSVNSGVILSDGQSLLYRRNKALYLAVADAAGTLSSARELPDHPFAFDGWGEQNVWITPDGRTAYFSADRPGGFGGTDMYVTRRVPKTPQTQ